MNIPDRKTEPLLKAPRELHLPELKKIRLNNGISAFFLKEGEQELVRMEFIFRAGKWFESRSLIATTTNALLNEGTKNYSSKNLAEAFDFYGAYLQFYAEPDRAGLILFCLSKFLDRTLPLVEDILSNSIFPEDEIGIYMDHSRQQFLINNQRVGFLAKQAFMNVIFGPDHPYGRPVQIGDFEHIKRSGLVDHFKAYYGIQDLSILVSGNWTESIEHLLDQHFGHSGWSLGQPGQVTAPVYNYLKSDKRTVVEKKDALQSAIRFGKPTINRTHPDFTGLRIVTTILGGYFGSRLMKNIREDKGYTYGIGAQLGSFENGGFFVVASEVGSQVCRNALKEVVNEVHKLREETVPEAELQLVKNYLAGNWLRLFDGPMVSAESYRVLIDYNLDESYFKDAFNLLLGMTAERVQQLAQTYLDPKEMVEVVGGVY